MSFAPRASLVKLALRFLPATKPALDDRQHGPRAPAPIGFAIREFVQKDRRLVEFLGSQVGQGKSEIDFGVSPF
jgi:hypothetical protein